MGMGCTILLGHNIIACVAEWVVAEILASYGKNRKALLQKRG